MRIVPTPGSHCGSYARRVMTSRFSPSCRDSPSTDSTTRVPVLECRLARAGERGCALCRRSAKNLLPICPNPLNPLNSLNPLTLRTPSHCTSLTRNSCQVLSGARSKSPSNQPPPTGTAKPPTSMRSTCSASPVTRTKSSLGRPISAPWEIRISVPHGMRP